MDRLTKYEDFFIGGTKTLCNTSDDFECNLEDDEICTVCEHFNKMINKLAKYEDIGLTPEQILAMDEEYAKLSKELGEHKKKLENIERYLDKCKL